MDQETLFELQEYVADLVLRVAQEEEQTDDLIESFKWLYRVE